MSYQRRKDARPEEICTAALEVFTARGFAATRMSDIAKQAGVSRPTLYLYFANKEAIFKALVEQNILPVITDTSALVDQLDGPAWPLLDGFLTRFFNNVARPDVARICNLLISEGGQFPELARLYKEQLIDPGRNVISRILRQGAQTGEFPPEAADLDPRLMIAPALLSVIWGALFSQEEPLDRDKLAADHIALVRRGLIGR